MAIEIKRFLKKGRMEGEKESILLSVEELRKRGAKALRKEKEKSCVVRC